MTDSLRQHILGLYGKDGFDSHDRIRRQYIRKLAEGECGKCHGEICTCPDVSLKKRAEAALKLRYAKSQRRAQKRGYS